MTDFDIIQQQWNEEEEFEKLSLEFMEPLLKAWIALRNSTNITGETIDSYLTITDSAIKHCWGSEARVEMKEWELILIHPSGERIIKSLVET